MEHSLRQWSCSTLELTVVLKVADIHISSLVSVLATPTPELILEKVSVVLCSGEEGGDEETRYEAETWTSSVNNNNFHLISAEKRRGLTDLLLLPGTCEIPF